MARKRTIPKDPSPGKNYFLIDANVLAYAALPKLTRATSINITDGKEKDRAMRCKEWWKYINRQMKENKARVYVPDICIAEAFKVLAKWYYQKGFFQNAASYNQPRERLRKLVSTSHKDMARATRKVQVHDIATNRDIIIGVDRFFEQAFKNKKARGVSTVDLVLLAIAKYLIEFYDIPRNRLYIISCDRALVYLSKKYLKFMLL